MPNVAHATNSRNLHPHIRAEPPPLQALQEANRRLRAENVILEQINQALRRFAERLEEARRTDGTGRRHQGGGIADDRPF